MGLDTELATMCVGFWMEMFAFGGWTLLNDGFKLLTLLIDVMFGVALMTDLPFNCG